MNEDNFSLPTIRDAARTAARFSQEATAIARLAHRNIVQVYDHDDDGRGHYIVMEYVPGGTLRDYLREKGGALEPAEAVRIAREIAQGLSYAHRNDIIHRDIKPSNILLSRDGDEAVPRIVDFGLARMESGSDLSMSGYGMGTPYYMPPEQRRDAKNVNHTADLYALGKTLYEMVSGEVPDVVDPDKVPEALFPVINRCVKTKPSERFFSADEFIEALDGIGSFSSRRRRARAGSANACPNCGAENPPEAEFCGGCGSGLFRECPECSAKVSVLQAFCRQCGTDVEAFLHLRECVAKAAQYIAGKRWGRLQKLAETESFQEGSFRGPKGAASLAEFQAHGALAKARIEERDAANAEAERLEKAGKIDGAIAAVEKSLAIDPHQEALAGRKADLAKKRAEAARQEALRKEREDRDAACAALSAAVAARDRKAVAAALLVLRKRWPDAPELATARDTLAQWDAEDAAAREARERAEAEKRAAEEERTADAAEAAAKEETPAAKPATAPKTRRTWRWVAALLAAGAVALGAVWLHSNAVERERVRAEAEAETLAQEAAEKKAAEEQASREAEEKRLAAEKKAAEEQAAREAEEKRGSGGTNGEKRTFTVDNVSFNMVYVEPGTFQMGSNDGDSDEKPVHTVTLTQGYWMGETEVTQALWKKVMGTTVSMQRDKGNRNWPLRGEGNDYPMYYVSWNECQEFVKKLNESQKGSGVEFRLPTEAEWEFAARGGKQSKGTKYSGSDNLDEVAWFGDNSGGSTHPVKGKKANELGLYDMSGNVWEWCSDLHGGYPSGSVTDPTGPASGGNRVFRGGCWGLDARHCRVAYRNWHHPDARGNGLGLRLAASAGLQSAP